MSFFEAGMLICFGVSWPISIVKALRTKKVVGKSPLFMTFICIGTLCGIVHKVLYAFDWVTFLYILNMAMVATDIFLYYRYMPAKEPVDCGCPRAVTVTE
jgi:hypothetical protein